MGLEPTRIAPYAPETYAYTNSATAANKGYYMKKISYSQEFFIFKFIV